MKQKFILILVLALAQSLGLYAQAEPEVTVVFLANDKIAAVNMDQDKYIADFKTMFDLVKTEFKDVGKDQKISILLVSHKTGKPTIEFYAKPKVSADKEQAFLNKMKALPLQNTKIVDLPVLINVNIAEDKLETEFKEFVLPADRFKKEYEAADLKKKYELNKAWAINEILPILSAYQKDVDEKFLGVKRTGKLVSTTNFNNPQDISALSSKSPDYWRAVLEMNAGNQLIPATKIFMHISQGEFDHAEKYLEMVRYFSDPKTITNDYLEELNWRLDVFDVQLNTEIDKGIKQHDKGNYEAAMTIYKNLLSQYPNSAWAKYELYYSQNKADVMSNKIKLEDRTNWDKAKGDIYKANPLYGMDVRASNAKEGYLLFRRQGISELFKDKKQALSDIYKYADIAMDLGVYDFAAQLFWFYTSYSKEDNDALNKFLYCIEKLGVSSLKQNFKGDFDAAFKKIEAAKEKEMKESPMYKAFKE